MNLSKSFFEKNHFFQPTTEDEKKQLFKKSVLNVVIEISSYCNRHCSYCPVSQVDRSSSNIMLPNDIFKSIIQDLVEIDYSGGICLNLYNEPTSDRKLLLSRIGEVRKQLPDSRIYFGTNGDFLTPEYIKEMVDVGLSEMYVTPHIAKGKEYSDTYILSRFCELSVRLNKSIKITTVIPNHTVQGNVSLFGLPINIFSTNYDVFGYDRAGLITSLTSIAAVRTAPCDRPFNDFTISYDGTIFPCCQMFADNENHQKNFSIGNISDFSNIFDAFSSKTMAAWRTSLLRFGVKSKPCDTCPENNLVGKKDEHRERDHIYKKYIESVKDKKKSILVKGIFSFLKRYEK